ncbi:MAG: hypothetical protein RDV48_15900 [Candidatus Eremiobacteraeota bacterium]|nr:hypothetical protein [Candidatus Eremiobacteraeota bacterium]
MVTNTASEAERLTGMLQEALTFEGKFSQQELERFREGFRRTVEDFAREMGYRDREEMLRSLSAAPPEELERELILIGKEVKSRSRNHMDKIADIFFNNPCTDYTLRTIIQVLLQALRKRITLAENELSKAIAEMLYGFVTLTALRLERV